MIYQNNKEELEKVIRERTSIRHVSKHRKPDGSIDIEGNLKLWNDLMEKFEKIWLWENGAPGFDDRDQRQTQPYMVFIPSADIKINRGTIIVAHGGGFETRTGCEGFHVAEYFNRAGFAVAILSYRLKPYSRRDAIADMHRAIRILRARKEELGISDKVAVMGFSAGGMLAGNCATHFDYGKKDPEDILEYFSCRPDAAVIGYGAISFASFPSGFMKNPFIDKNKAEELYLAPEKNITIETPPFFIWQTNSDDPRFSMYLAKELADFNIPFELHCFPNGIHGLALADGNNDLNEKIPHIMHWSTLCSEWLEALGF
ncbi:MAG: acetylesterase [Herbinix sp.]|jgi:acetyl esterase/lipase|nr:acetylesterase [Herbinix sp.]